MRRRYSAPTGRRVYRNMGNPTLLVSPAGVLLECFFKRCIAFKIVQSLVISSTINDPDVFSVSVGFTDSILIKRSFLQDS